MTNFETNEFGETVAVTTLPNGTVIRELQRTPISTFSPPISKREFLKLFTPVEYGAIKTAASVNTTVDYYWQQFLLAEFISLSDVDTLAGLELLENAGLLADGRAAEIVG